MTEQSQQVNADIIPCPDCGKTENRDYSIFRYWFAEPQRDMVLLLGWVKTQPCNQCAVKRHHHQGRRPKRVDTESE
jgi:hypothetical protein